VSGIIAIGTSQSRRRDSNRAPSSTPVDGVALGAGGQRGAPHVGRSSVGGQAGGLFRRLRGAEARSNALPAVVQRVDRLHKVIICQQRRLHSDGNKLARQMRNP